MLFLGAGVGASLTQADGSPAPDGQALAENLADRFNIDLGEEAPELAAVAELVELRKGRLELEAHLSKILSDLQPDEAFRKLVTFGWQAIFTTNYDDAIERCFALDPEVKQVPVSYSVTADLNRQPVPPEVPIYHLHGSLSAPGESRRLVITETDYTKYSERRRMLFDMYRLQFATSTIVYVGYSHRDNNWRSLTAELRAEMLPATPPPAYRIAPRTPTLQQEILGSFGITTVDGGLDDFTSALPSGAPLVTAAERRDPPALAALGCAQPVALDRLLHSWTYVNAADFAGAANVKEFFRGAPPTWGLVGQGVNFERDLEQQLLDEVVDYLTGPADQARAHVVLGSAGYGMSTLLMAVAAWLARGNAGPILSLRPGAVLRPGDVVFAARQLGPVAFMVDDASDVADEVYTALGMLREAGLGSIFIMADRLNEWRERRPRVGCTEWALEPLSDLEIEKLLVALETNHELGELEALTPELRFSSIKVRHAKELLVTLREVTEGRDFDAIIEGEYRGIIDETARRTYLTVSCFSQVRVLMRADLASKLLEVNIAGLYSDVLPKLEGVVRLVPLAREEEALATRHHSIATVLWQRCGGRVERQDICLAAMAGINLAFNVDAKAFEALTRSDELVDDFESLDAKTAFFESALRKAPDSPDVRLHYARMLRRAERYETALSQVDAALLAYPSHRHLHHQRGVILRDMARSVRETDLARRRLAQSEESFEAALRINPRDEYAFQSLSELYIMWAERLSGQLESVSYVEKAQETLQRGLGVVRHREGLYVVASRIEQFVGNTPAQISALQQAVRENSQALVARYLLGNALRLNDRLEESAEVLLEGLQLDPEHVGLAVSYALTLEAQERPRAESIAVLRQALGLGGRDARFVALLGGLYEMNGDLSASKAVFQQAKKRTWTIFERNNMGYRPRSDRLAGRCASHRGGFAFLRSPGHSDVYCPGSAFPDAQFAEGDPVTFCMAFDVRGPRAVDVQRATAT